MTIFDVLRATEAQLYNEFLSIPATAKYYSPGKYLYLDRQAPICLVAHLDTLPRKSKWGIAGGNILSVEGGGILGADDRAGVYAIHVLQDYPCDILLTSGEETGGTGAKQAAHDLQDTVMNHVKLMIELDRAGVRDYVYYTHFLHDKIHDYLTSFGYHEMFGSYSDIAEFNICPAVNLSIGFYNQHTNVESLVLDEMCLNIKRVRKMLQAPISRRYDEPKERSDYPWGDTGYWSKPKKRRKRDASDIDVGGYFAGGY